MTNDQTKILVTEVIRETEKSWYLNCEGTIEWFPKSQCKLDAKDLSLTLPNWLFDKLFPDG